MATFQRVGVGLLTLCMFAARQLQEKSHEQNSEPYIKFVDLTKAFDTVSHEGLWKPGMEDNEKVWLP